MTVSTRWLLFLVALAPACTTGASPSDDGGETREDDGGQDADAGRPDGGPCTGTVAGQVRLPNGVFSAVGARIYVSRSGTVEHRGSCGQCLAPESLLAHTLTDQAGRFELSLPEGTHEVVIRKGGFQRTTSVAVSCGEQQVLDPDDVRLPRTPAEGELPRIAVIAGHYDAVEQILARFGLGVLMTDPRGVAVEQAQFDFFPHNPGARRSGGYLSDETRALLRDGERLAEYDIVLINCGSEIGEVGSDGLGFMLEPEVADNLRAYVERGGRLYLTDLEYSILEALWPQAIDFHGSPEVDGLTATPERSSAASVGEGHIDPVHALVSAPALSDWLEVNGLASDGSIAIDGLVPGWTMVDRTAASVQTWVEFPSPDPRPLAMTFEVGCGRVLFSSYHVSETDRSVSMWPSAQEAVLAYLIFQLSECIAEPEFI